MQNEWGSGGGGEGASMLVTPWGSVGTQLGGSPCPKSHPPCDGEAQQGWEGVGASGYSLGLESKFVAVEEQSAVSSAGLQCGQALPCGARDDEDRLQPWPGAALWGAG